MALSTFKELFQLYYTRHALVKLKCPANVKYWGTVYGEKWFDVCISDISSELIQQWVDERGTTSKSAATRAVNQMGAIFNWGMKRGYCSANPCVGVERFLLPKRDRFMFPTEIQRMKPVLAKQPQLIHDLVWIFLLTGARKANVLEMEWQEIDLDLRLWRIPPEKFKNGESHLVPLVDQAAEILKRRKENSDSPYVFPGVPGQWLKDPKRAWVKVKEQSQIKNLRMHDLRRTTGSYMAIAGEGQYVIGKLLGHRDPRSTAIYAKLNLGPVRKALDSVQETYSNQ